MDYTGQSLDREQGDEPKLPEQPLDTDFAKKFPPDPTLGDEVGETARVWKVYRAEAEAHDNTMLDGWNKTLDVLLIFAGLFSAVATAFLIDSYKLLQPDTSAVYISTALYLLVMRDNVSSSIVLPPPPPLAISTSTISRAVNWLWFTSLLLALSVALLGILVKQWIVEYTARNAVSAESPIKWAIRRQMYFIGIITWPVADLVSVLPVMLHASLFFFFCGVALFVWNLDRAIGVWLAVLGLLLCVFYMACSFLPLWIPECPTSTPHLQLVRRYFFELQICMLRLGVYLCSRIAQLHALARRVISLFHARFTSDSVVSSVTSRDSPTDEDQSGPALASDTETSSVSPGADIGHSHTIRQLTAAISYLRARQKRSMVDGVPKEREDALKADGLLWLMFSVADSDARAVGMQTLGAVPAHSALAKYLRTDARLSRIDGQNLDIRSEGGSGPVEEARIVRTMLWSRDNNSAPDKTIDIHLWQRIHFPDIDYPDMLFLSAVKHSVSAIKHSFWTEVGEIPPPPYKRPSASISSTVLLFLRARRLGFIDLVTSLLWCDFGGFTDADWTFVLGRIISEGSSGASLLLLPCTDPLVCIADVLAQSIMQSAAIRNNVMVHRLFISLLKRMVHFRSDFDRIYFSSFILAYLVSDSFAEQRVQPDALQSLVSTVLRVASRVAEAYPPAMETYFNLLCDLFPLLLHQLGEVPRSTCMHSARVLVAYNAPGRVQDGQVLCRTLRRILMPSDRQPLHCVWDMLRGAEDGALLAYRLAVTLCMADRAGEDVSAMVDTFLSHLSLQILFEMHKAQVGYHWTYNFAPVHFLLWVTPIIQTCVDLRPAWWFEVLSALREDESAEPELKQYLHELEAIPLYRGICDLCHRLPLGWEDDDDPPSSCAFSPASPGLSTVPPSTSTSDARTPWYCSLCDFK